MKSILDLPSEIRDKIFCNLDADTLQTLSQTCRGLSKAYESTRSFRWTPQFPNAVIETLPLRYPLLDRLEVSGNFGIDNAFAPWDTDHLSIHHVFSDTFYIAPHLLRCPKLRTFDFESLNFHSSHDIFFTRLFVPIMLKLLPRLSIVKIENHTTDSHDPFETFTLPAPVHCPHLKEFSFQVNFQPLRALHDFFSLFSFPSLTQLSLGHLKYDDNVRERMDWPEFVSHFKNHFPSLLHLELSHLYVDITDSLPPDLVSLSWSTWIPREDLRAPLPGITEFFLSKFIDVYPRLKKLKLHLPENARIHDDLANDSYPLIQSLEIDKPLYELERFPCLTTLRVRKSLERETRNVFEEICFDCPQLEHLELSVGYGTLNLTSPPVENDFPWLQNLKSLIIGTGACLYGTLLSLLSNHPKLELFRMNINTRIFNDNFNTSNLDTLSDMKDFRLFVYKRFDYENSVDLLSLIGKSLSLSKLEVIGLPYTSVALNFPTYWPSLQHYDHYGLVTGDVLREWAQNTFWPSALITLKISMHNLQSNWFQLLGILETHYTLRTCIVRFSVNDDDSCPVTELSQQQKLLLKVWNPKLVSDSLEWKRRVDKASRQELSQVIHLLSPDERTKDVEQGELRTVTQSILTRRCSYKVFFGVYFSKND